MCSLVELSFENGQSARSIALQSHHHSNALQVGWPECGYKPGQRPAIGETALHQVSFLIHDIKSPSCGPCLPLPTQLVQCVM